MFADYKDIFDQRARSYHSAMQRWPAARDAEFRNAIAPLRLSSGAVVADIPAGGGYLRRHLDPAIRYIAVEPSDYFYDRCPGEAGDERVRGSAERTGLPDRSADAVVSVAGLHHCADLDAVFAEFGRVVRRPGMLVMLEVEDGTPTGEFLNGFVDRHSAMGHDGRFFDGRTATRLARAGFAVESDELLTCGWSFDGREDVGTFARDLFGIDGAEPDAVADALEGMVGACAGSGAFGIAWTLRRIVARPAA